MTSKRHQCLALLRSQHKAQSCSWLGGDAAMSNHPAVTTKQGLTNQEKANRFRDESSALLTGEETSAVKTALALFLRNKVKVGAYSTVCVWVCGPRARRTWYAGDMFCVWMCVGVCVCLRARTPTRCAQISG